MRSQVFAFFICVFILGSAQGLGRKRVDSIETCAVVNGEKVCRKKEMNIVDDRNLNQLNDEVIFAEEKEEEDESCVDTHELCAFWASVDECTKNPNYMLKSCPKSCNSCPNTMVDGLTLEQVEEKDQLLAGIAKYGEPQEVEKSSQDKTMFVIRKSLDYMENFIHAEKPTHNLSEEVINACRNAESRCSYWATSGECDNNPSYMVTKCAPACLSCHKIDYDTRCGKRDPNLPPGLKPGELNLMFERIVATAPGNATEETQLLAQQGKVQEDGTPYYTVTVHSRPASDASKPDENGVIPVSKSQDFEEDPWVITFDNFLTDEECQHLIELGHMHGYKRSTDVGKKNADGSFGVSVGNGRTSENAWCDTKSGCRFDPIAARVMQRISNVTGIPAQNNEDLQLLKYEVGQYYRAHHDYIRHQKDRHSGPRMLTFFLYLTEVEEGGATRLNNLGIDITPKRGRALLWPSVTNHDPSSVDSRTKHEALAVLKGTKFAANAWIHMYDSIAAHKMGCN